MPESGPNQPNYNFESRKWPKKRKSSQFTGRKSQKGRPSKNAALESIILIKKYANLYFHTGVVPKVIGKSRRKGATPVSTGFSP